MTRSDDSLLNQTNGIEFSNRLTELTVAFCTIKKFDSFLTKANHADQVSNNIKGGQCLKRIKAPSNIALSVVIISARNL